MEIRSAPPLLTPASITAARPTLHRIARSAIPRLADFCFVFLALPSRIVCAAAAHGSAQGTRTVRALMRAYRVRPDDRGSTVASVIRSCRPSLRRTIRHDSTAAEGDLVAQLHRQLAPRSALAVPIVVRNTVLGALTVCYSQSGRSYASRDIPTIQRLAAQVGRVLTNAPLADAELRLRAATRLPRQGTTLRRRVAARD